MDPDAVTSSDRGVSETQIAVILAEITGETAESILSQMAASPNGDLAIPSPRAMTVLGVLRGRHGIRKEDIQRILIGGGFCSMRLLTDLVERKLGKPDGSA